MNPPICISVYPNSVNISAVTISPSGPVTATTGETITLQCLADITPNPLPQNTSSPEFERRAGRVLQAHFDPGLK